MHADGEVVDDPHRHARLAGGALGGGQLGVGEPGEAGVEVDAVHQLAAGAVGAGRAGVAQALGPAVPVGAVDLGERAPGGVVLQGGALFGEVVAVGGAAAGAQGDLVEQFQGLALQLPHGVPVDQGVLLQHALAQPPGPLPQGPGALVVGDVRELGHVLDPQMHRVGEAARGRPVRRRVGGGTGYGRVQRVDLDESGAEGATGPGGQFTEVAEVAHAPGAAGEEGVELDEEAVGAHGRGGQPGGRDDQVCVGGTPVGCGGGQPVHSVRKPPDAVEPLALLGVDAQPGARRQGGQRGRGAAAVPADDGGRQQPSAQLGLAGGERGPYGPGAARVHAEGGQREGDGGGRGRDGAVRGGAVGGGDAVQGGEPGQILGKVLGGGSAGWAAGICFLYDLVGSGTGTAKEGRPGPARRP